VNILARCRQTWRLRSLVTVREVELCQHEPQQLAFQHEPRQLACGVGPTRSLLLAPCTVHHGVSVRVCVRAGLSVFLQTGAVALKSCHCTMAAANPSAAIVSE